MSKNICPLESPLSFFRNLTNRDLLARFVQKLRTAEPAYSYIVSNRRSAIVELMLPPLIYIPLIYNPSCNRLLL